MEMELKQKAVIVDLDKIPKTYDDMLNVIEDVIINCNAQVELPLVHTFTPGLYSREIFLPKGSVATTKVHKKSHQFVVLKGEVVVITEEGAFNIKAPFHGTTKPGTTRLVLAVEDSIWTTFHECNLVKDKQYSQDELTKLVNDIESELVEDRRTLNKIEICHSHQ